MCHLQSLDECRLIVDGTCFIWVPQSYLARVSGFTLGVKPGRWVVTSSVGQKLERMLFIMGAF